MKTLLFGGSFNPIHYGHLISATSIAEQLNASRTILIPAAVSPHKLEEKILSGLLRTQMCEIATHGDLRLETNDWETKQEGPSYSISTVKHFLKEDPDAEIFLLLGMDNLEKLNTWHKIEELSKLCVFVVADRPGFNRTDHDNVIFLKTPRIEISSTDIRQRILSEKSVRYLLPDSVIDFIYENHLYKKIDPTSTEAMQLSRCNENLIKGSNRCGCFHCLKIFPSREVANYLENNAICPHCNIDAVIPDCCVDLNQQYLSSMYDCWMAVKEF